MNFYTYLNPIFSVEYLTTYIEMPYNLKWLVVNGILLLVDHMKIAKKYEYMNEYIAIHLFNIGGNGDRMYTIFEKYIDFVLMQLRTCEQNIIGRLTFRIKC